MYTDATLALEFVGVEMKPHKFRVIREFDQVKKGLIS
jgi:hypothetical protein